MIDLVQAVHARFMTGLLVFVDGIDADAVAEVATGAARARLLEGTETLSVGYESVIETTHELAADEYLVAACSRDLSQPSIAPRIRTTRIVAAGNQWHVADFYTAGVGCTLPDSGAAGGDGLNS